jgi:hypothetical protein
MIISRRMRWARDMAHMGEKRNTYRVKGKGNIVPVLN